MVSLSSLSLVWLVGVSCFDDDVGFVGGDVFYFSLFCSADGDDDCGVVLSVCMIWMIDNGDVVEDDEDEDTFTESITLNVLSFFRSPLPVAALLQPIVVPVLLLWLFPFVQRHCNAE